MTTTELILAVLLVLQSTLWVATDLGRHLRS